MTAPAIAWGSIGRARRAREQPAAPAIGDQDDVFFLRSSSTNLTSSITGS